MGDIIPKFVMLRKRHETLDSFTTHGEHYVFGSTLKNLDDYNSIEEDFESKSINGLSLHLGFSSKEEMAEYVNEKSLIDIEWKKRLAYFISQIELFWEEKLMKNPRATNAIALQLMTNHKWSTKQEISGTQTHTLKVDHQRNFDLLDKEYEKEYLEPIKILPEN